MDDPISIGDTFIGRQKKSTLIPMFRRLFFYPSGRKTYDY